MAANLYTNQSTNMRKTWVLMSMFFVIVILLGWFVSYYFQNPGILFFAVIFSIFMNIFSYWYSDKIVLKMSGAKEASKEKYWDLYTTVENLSITAGLPMPKIYVIEEPVPNAFATGRDKDHAVVAFTTGILSLLNKTELEGVVAHELSHIGNRDILLQTVVVVLVGFVTLLADFFLRVSLYGGGNRNSEGGGKMQMVLLVIGVVFVLLSPVIATLIQLAISRKREFLADASGAMLTRYPEGLASALEKISGHGGKMKKANHATAHLFISDPYGGKKKKISFLHKIFLTHPPVEERVGSLRGHRNA
ncbi:MAG: heat shock protein HtpX [Candidatus Paceibacteria bacterium]|jgi:heat shock protein HtpX